MARILIATTSLMGHIVPILPLARELVQRGHDVRWYSGEGYRQRIESTGARHIGPTYARDVSLSPIHEQFPERDRSTGIHSLLFDIEHIFAAEAVGQTMDLQEIVRQEPADLMFADSAFLAHRWVHELGGPPWATLNPFTVNLSGRDTPPFGLGSPPAATQVGRFRVAAQQQIGQRLLYRRTTRYVDRLRQRIGLPPTGEVFWDRALSPYLYMQGSIPGLEYPRHDLPPQFHFIGPTLSVGATPDFEPPEWWGELESGRPVILVTQGTLSTNPDQLLRPAINALGDIDALVIVTTGGTPIEEVTRGQSIPTNVRVESFVPFDQLLPHVDLMVTNGGYNGVQQALAHGIPLIVAGATEDKLEVNARVHWTGVGIDLMTQTPRPEEIELAARQILDSPDYRVRAEELSREFREMDGIETGANLIETLLRTDRPVLRS
jgi:MGT family glycosyltransferase